jgi:hypothetical protein
LFSGKLLEAFRGNASSSGRYVHVFDLAGKLIAVLDLGTDAAAIEVDGAMHTLYSLGAYDEPRVLRYRLLPSFVDSAHRDD